MNQILSIFLPAAFAMYVYKGINKKEITNQEMIIRYFTFVLLINIASYLVSVYIFGNIDFIFNSLYTVKYLCMSSVFATIIATIMSFIEKNVEINIRVDKK